MVLIEYYANTVQLLSTQYEQSLPHKLDLVDKWYYFDLIKMCSS